MRSAKDGCSPQGQCGCCTVLVDGAPRVACVTPARRVAGRSITTLDGLGPEVAGRWADALTATGGSQCGFCTPGIIVRLESLRAARRPARRRCRARPGRRGPHGRRPGPAGPPVPLHGLAHHPRRRGPDGVAAPTDDAPTGTPRPGGRGQPGQPGGRSRPSRWARPWPWAGAGSRPTPAPADALVAVPDGAGGWAVGETLAEARRAAGKVQGRRTTAAAEPPLAVARRRRGTSPCAPPGSSRPTSSPTPPGAAPAVSRCRRWPTAAPSGARSHSSAPAAARDWPTDTAGRCWCCSPARTRCASAPSGPPIAAGARADGTGVVHVVRTPGIADRIRAAAPGLRGGRGRSAGPAHLGATCEARAGPRPRSCWPR